MNKEFMTIITGPAATGKTMYLDKLACESDYGCVLIDPYNSLNTYLKNFNTNDFLEGRIITLDFSNPETLQTSISTLSSKMIHLNGRDSQ